jgi:hypothetical protein
MDKGWAFSALAPRPTVIYCVYDWIMLEYKYNGNLKKAEAVMSEHKSILHYITENQEQNYESG